MPFTQWFQSPRRTLTVFLCLMVVLGSALGWLGWQVIERDRLAERGQVQDRVERAADRIAADLQRTVADFERGTTVSAGSSPGALAAGVVVLHATAGSLTVHPSPSLLFVPAAAGFDDPVAATFAAGEALEFQANDPGAASDSYRKLARSPHADVRAGALMRLGRTLRKAGRNAEALAAFSDLARLGATPVVGLPAALAAREARGSVLEAMGRNDELREEATQMAAALWGGRYLLTRPVWEFLRQEAQRWGGDEPPAAQARQALALSKAAQWVHERWSAGARDAGRRTLAFEGESVLIAWAGAAERLDAALAGSAYLRGTWLQVLRGQQVEGALIDTDGQLSAGSIVEGVPRAVRTPDATGLPWTLYVKSADPAADAAFFAGRRRLLASGFAVLAFVLVAGSYFISRSIARELAVTRLQSEFVSTVSHEFRTPLTSIRQLAEMLAKGRVPTDDLRQQSYGILLHESERLQRLVESLLDFGRIEAGAMRYTFERLDGSSLVEDVVAGFRGTAAAHGFRIDVRGADAPAIIRADREALSLAVHNLLDNAVKYSPECRTVWVEMASAEGRLAIRVRDRGVGIPVAEQRSIFKRFVRGSANRQAGVKGTGIGLTLARHIVGAHHGEIRLTSSPGQGSTFTILLPTEDSG